MTKEEIHRRALINKDYADDKCQLHATYVTQLAALEMRRAAQLRVRMLEQSNRNLRKLNDILRGTT